MENTFKQEKLILRLSLNPGLALTGFRTTRPRCIGDLINKTLLPELVWPANIAVGKTKIVVLTLKKELLRFFYRLVRKKIDLKDLLMRL